ncbi:MAG: response regulator transcription factor [Spirochaetales bacterium]|jgi:DNA-binding NarL/FixJ family response regulator|nr:response regulator transcription factor [Spirochaetales bacterium]
MEKNEFVRVLVIQGRCLLRDTLLERLRGEYGIEVCALADGVDGVPAQIEQHDPHVLLINVGLKCGTGPLAIARLKRNYREISVVALSCDVEFEDLCIGQAIQAGADSYVSIEDSVDDLIFAIRSVARGKAYRSELTESKLTRSVSEDMYLQNLSMQEVQVFSLSGCGYVPRRVAEKMGLSVKTVETYRERIRSKLNIITGADLLYAATTYMRNVSRRNLEEDHLVDCCLQPQVGRERFNASVPVW